MKKRSILLSLLGVILLLSLALVACDNGDDTEAPADRTEPATEVPTPPADTEGTEPTEPPTGDLPDDPIIALVPPHIAAMINRSTPFVDVEPGGILRYAAVQTDPFAGILHPIWSMSAVDGNDIQPFFLGAMHTIDDDFLLDPNGSGAVETFTISEDGLVIRKYIRDNVYWHDGVQLTARDWQFAYEVLAHADSTTTRFRQQNSDRIVGIEEFHAGEVDYIAGIRIIDDLTIEFEFDRVVPIFNTVFTHPLPYHIFGDIPVDEMEDSPYVRTAAAIGFGPFIIDVIVPGESITFVRNDNFWAGAPLLDGVELRVVHPEVLGAELEAGNIDVANSFSEANFPYFEHLSNINFLKAPGWAWNAITFRVGYFDQDAGQAALDPDAPMSNVDLRRAMWMAIDTDLIADTIFNGLRWAGSTVLPPIHSGFHNPNAQRPPFSMEAAHALLDEAGFAFDGDYRTNPDGSPLELQIIWASAGGDATQMAVQQYHITQWRALGLNMLDPREYEFAVFGDLFTTAIDDTDWDIQLNAWSSGSNPSPSGFFHPSQSFNRSRYTSERMDDLLARIDGEQAALDPHGYRREVLFEFQEYVLDVAAVIPTQFRFAFIPVNNRVVNFEILATASPRAGWHTVGLIRDTPYRHGE
jgi:peptide/nickel transport system substrate-binding protein